MEEKHLDGTYLAQNNFSVLLGTINSMPEDAELKESTEKLIGVFALADSPEGPIEDYKKSPYGPPTFRSWMGDITAYREGRFAYQLLERLGDNY